MHQGSCLCGSVRYEIHGDISSPIICHCQKCRKVNGSAYAVNGLIKSAEFKLLTDPAVLKEYSSSEGVYRVFCGNCGAPIYSRRDNDPAHYRLRLGLLDTPLPQPPQAHIFVASKAEWEQICDNLPQYAERP